MTAFCTEPQECIRGGAGLSYQEQFRRFEEQHAVDAWSQVEWEARASEQSAAWRARVEEGEGEGGEPPA